MREPIYSRLLLVLVLLLLESHERESDLLVVVEGSLPGVRRAPGEQVDGSAAEKKKSSAGPNTCFLPPAVLEQVEGWQCRIVPPQKARSAQETRSGGAEEHDEGRRRSLRRPPALGGVQGFRQRSNPGT